MTNKVFIGSSSECLDVARAVRTELSHDHEVTLWTDRGTFQLGNTNIECLEEISTTHLFAVLILDGDDVVESRGDKSPIPRDNVIFELGMFIGTLSRHQVFALCPEHKKPKLPSDIAGMTLAHYKVRSNGELDVGPACDSIRKAIDNIGTDLAHLEIPGEVERLSMSLSKAGQIENQAFQTELGHKVADWIKESAEWERGEVYVRRNYASFLCAVYKAARSNIFSTSIPDYNKFWGQDLGRSLLQAQSENSDAECTRVFVFDSISDFDDQHRSILAEQVKSGVHAYCYFNLEDKDFDLSPDVGKDWTVIDDGDVIGITHDLGSPDPDIAATWHFCDDGRRGYFASQRDRLLDICKLRRWKSREDGTLESESAAR
ncbi:MAG: nucleotide-binding protein [Pseudomonadota bacterium]